MDSAEHEALCRRCGMSCHFAVPVNGLAVVIDALRCKFLARSSDSGSDSGSDSSAGQYHCTIYADRFAQAPWCHTADSALSGGFLAQDCPYAKGTPGYRGKVRLSASLYQKVLPAIRAEIARVGIPIGAAVEPVLALLTESGGKWSHSVSADGSRYLFARSDTETPNPETPNPETRVRPVALRVL